MNSKNFFTISLVGIFIVLFFSGVLLGYLCYALFFDNKITPPENTHQISLSTTLETENIFQKEEENHPTILTHEDVPIEKIDSKSFTLEKPILTFIKENIDLEDFS
ncbi:MAG: hypothetical protein IKZ25_01245, partial [Clostridia bacterium]|nr:hypothetical protein [Clostridia bacterium]